MGKEFIQLPSFNFDLDGTLSKWNYNVSLEEVGAEGYFKTPVPHSDVILASRILCSMGYTVRTYGAAWLDDGHSVSDKNWWLDRHAPHIKLSDRCYLPCGMVKADYFESFYGREITRLDILIDDYSPNLREWEAAGGTAVKVRTPENGRHGTWKGPSFSASDSAENIALYLLSVVDTFTSKGMAM